MMSSGILTEINLSGLNIKSTPWTRMLGLQHHRDGWAQTTLCSPLVFLYVSYGTSWENLHKHQDMFCLVTISFIIVTCMFDQVRILQG